MVSIRTGEFLHEGHRVVYDEYGSGPRPLLLLPGLLLPRTLHRPLATDLAARGHRVITPDLLGHGEADRPSEMWHYSSPQFAAQVVALMDHLGLEEAAVGGPSAGANVALETCVAAPERVRGAVIEMPVLESALIACALTFGPLLVAFTLGRPVTRLVSRIARAIPRSRSEHPVVAILNAGLDAASQDPEGSAAYLQGLILGRIAPPHSERQLIQTETLVLGHPRDPIHPFSDADMVARELPNARMVRAGSILELRLSPDRLTGEISQFLDECWAPAAASPRRRGVASQAG